MPAGCSGFRGPGSSRRRLALALCAAPGLAPLVRPALSTLAADSAPAAAIIAVERARTRLNSAGAAAAVDRDHLLLARWPVQSEVRHWRYLVLHHSASESGSVESIDADHRQRLDAAGRPWRGIGYHFVIGNGSGLGDGAVEATFRWREQLEGAHAGVAEFNELGLGICLIGDFDQTPPTERQREALVALVQALQREFRIGDDCVLRHGDLKSTACPGNRFNLADALPPRSESLRAAPARP